jgi:hypothetical protein
MSDQHVTVARFPNPTEAELAKTRLEEEGIPVLLLGELTATAYAGFGEMVGGIQLQVPQIDAERARRFLDAEREQRIEHKRARGIPATAGGQPAWICPGCDTHVDKDIEICPTCGRVMPVHELDSAGEPEDEDEDEDLQPTAIGDRLAHRAFLTAIFGLFTCPGLLHVYAVCVLWKLAGFEGGVTSTGRWKAYVAALISIPMVLAMLLVLVYILLHRPVP